MDSSYRGEVTAAGAPSEELLDSAEQEPRPRSRGWVALVLALLLVAIGLFGFQALQPDPVTGRAEPTQTSVTSAADPSLVDASARREYGESQRTGVQSFSLAVRVANDVVRIYCRADVPSWAANLVSSSESYEQATFLMSPANRAYGTFFVQVELTWTVDHYSFAAVAGHLERCV